MAVPGVLTQTVRPVLEFRLHLQLEAGLVTSVLQPYGERSGRIGLLWPQEFGGCLVPTDSSGCGRVEVLALIVFSCIFGEGYSNTHDSQQLHCVFNKNEDACRYGSAIGVLAFLASAFFLVVDALFSQISNATDRKYLVIGDLLFSALWTFLWFVGFCFLTNQWAATKSEDVRVQADSARAAITFSFFSIFSWGVLASLAYQRYKVGVDAFIQNYVDPTPDPNTAYSSYPSASVENYQQPPFTQNVETTEGYQPPPVY